VGPFREADMPTRPLAVCRVIALPDSGSSDADLLARFADGRSPGSSTADADAAFEALVRRHGPMVHAVCRRVLGRSADADDAFQATFLVLLTKARAIRARAAVGNWLYGVAYRTATHLKARAARRRPVPTELDAMPAPQPDDAADLLAALDDELARLPDKYRAVLVLCELSGQTIAAAARALGVPTGTAASRLARGRQLLAERLNRRGLPATAVAVSAALATSARARVPPALTRATTKLSSATPPTPGTVPDLTAEVLKMMLIAKLKTTTRLCLAAGAAGALLVALFASPAPPAAVAAAPPGPAQVGFGGAAPAKDNKQARLEVLWADLADYKEPKAVKAAIALAAAPKETTEFLKTRLKPVPAKVDADAVKAWVADLESDTPSTRDRAAAELRHVAPLIEKQLAEAHQNAKSEAARALLDDLWFVARGDLVIDTDAGGTKRITRVVVDVLPAGAPPGTPVRETLAMGPGVLHGLSPVPSWRQTVRAVGMLESFGTPEAVEILKSLAGGHPGVAPTIAAKEALARLEKASAK
jgi:RNA polymerase sigma factor (sigma-70 family)